MGRNGNLGHHGSSFMDLLKASKVKTLAVMSLKCQVKLLSRTLTVILKKPCQSPV